jgi:hypothetical protein
MLIVPAVNTDAMYKLAAEVSSKHDLQRFADRLADDYVANGEVWVNHSIPDFLRAFAVCLLRAERATASGELPQGTQLVSWQYLARLLLASSVARVRRHPRTAAAQDGDPAEPQPQPAAAVD